MNEAQIFSIHVLAGTSLAHRPDFLASLAEQRNKRFQVVVVDGGERLSQEGMFSVDVINLRNFREATYAKGHNQAIALALQRWPQEQWQERFIVLARPEAVFHPRCLELFAEAFAADPTLMLAGPKMLLAEAGTGLDQEINELQLTKTVYEVGYECRKDRHLRFLGAEEEDHDYPSREVFGISEPCLVIRASALERLRQGSEQWLDESLPRGQELIDLCWRAHIEGLVVKVIPEACVWFIPSEAREQIRARRHIYLAGPVREKNDWLTLELLHFPWICLSTLRSSVYLLTHPRELRARLRAWYLWHRLRRPSVQSSSNQVSVTEMKRWFV